MIRFAITAARMDEAVNILDFIGIAGGNYGTISRVAPRFILGADGNYIVKVNYDDDGDIVSFENYPDALAEFAKIPAKRLKKLVGEFQEAAQQIVNPPKGQG